MLPDEVLAKEVDRRASQHPARNQGTEPTCVAFALTALRECVELSSLPLSPRYLHHYCKESDGTQNQLGTYLRNGTQILLTKGVCEETVWPYPRLTSMVPPNADANALSYRTSGFVRLDDADPQLMLRNMRLWLSTRGCFVAGLWVYESWGQSQACNTGVVPEPTVFDKYWGGHAICITGYHEQMRRFTFKNSWGDNWGDAGYGYISYEHLAARCFEAWGIQSPDEATD